jgi:hypothetical protein
VNTNSAAIQSLIQANDYRELGKYVDGLTTNRKPGYDYFDDLLTVYRCVAELGAPCEDRKRFVLMIAETALGQNATETEGTTSAGVIRRQEKFLQVLLNENVFGKGAEDYRARRCRLLATLFGKINEARNLKQVPFSAAFKQLPVQGGTPDTGAPLSNVSNTLAARNQALQREWERIDHEIGVHAERQGLMGDSKVIYARWEVLLKRFFIEAYRNDPENRGELGRWLGIGGFSREFVDDVLAGVTSHVNTAVPSRP